MVPFFVGLIEAMADVITRRACNLPGSVSGEERDSSCVCFDGGEFRHGCSKGRY